MNSKGVLLEDVNGMEPITIYKNEKEDKNYKRIALSYKPAKVKEILTFG